MSVPSWDEFIKLNLLSTKLIHGVILLTKNGQIVYSYGDLESPESSSMLQFMKPFQGCTGTEHTEFILVLKTGERINFKIYQRTRCSLYGASEGGKNTITVCNLPYGILVCTFHHPVVATQAITAIEKFCDVMRA